MVGVSLQDLANIIFVANKHDAAIELTLRQLEGPRDLFFFLLHLFCKGIVLVSGAAAGTGSVSLDDLPASTLATASRKMANIGVRCHIAHETTTGPGPPSVRYEEVRRPVSDVSDLCFVMRTRARQVVRVWFQLERQLSPKSCARASGADAHDG